jgi:DNA primase
MEIPELKRHLSITDVAQALGIKLSKHDKALCPFHDDKTPSLQFSREKNICTCFSSRCDAGSMDIIDLVEKKQGCTKHEAIVWLTKLAGFPMVGNPTNNNGKVPPAVNIMEAPLERIAVLTKAFRYFASGMRRSPPAKAYAQKRMLDIDKLDIGYHNGKFHQGQNKLFIESAIRYGLLCPFAHGGYQQFGKDSLVFALKNAQQQITGMYFRSIRQEAEVKHVYLKNRQGLYPCYPTPDTQHLILTESIIDCATLLLHQESFPLPAVSLLALYGTNGLTEEH